jgi:hypothetical protein
VTRDLQRVVAVMSRYCDDLIPCNAVEAASRDDLREWERAAIDVASALRYATGCLRRAVDEPGGDASLRPGRHLATAAEELAAARDLLHTHLATDPDGLRRERSEWAPVVTSLPVTRALVHEIARWSRQLAPFTAWLAGAEPLAMPHAPGRHTAAGVRDELTNASQWLQVAGAAVRPALGADPVRAADTELLHAIPAATPPQRRRPGAVAESVAELCDGIAISASRLRAAARGSRERAIWSPNVTSGGWQWIAQAAAVTSHLNELVLRSLAVRVRQLAGPGENGTRLNAAADSMADMRAAWHQVDQMWDMMITESRLLPTLAMTDASDLVLRMGRLVWDKPDWTPADSRHATRRTAAALAPEVSAFAGVVSAAHQAVDAFARLAISDTEAVAAAMRAGRLYTPTRSLPADYNVPRPFAPAPTARYRALQGAYHVALDASIHAAHVLDGLAIAIGAPSRVLGLARAAVSMQSHRRGSQSQIDPDDLRSSDLSFMHSRFSTGVAGPVEQAIRDLKVDDPVILLRAAAIDDAARQLIIQADNALPAAGSSVSLMMAQPAASSTAQLVAQSFPSGPVAERPTDAGLTPRGLLNGQPVTKARPRPRG